MTHKATLEIYNEQENTTLAATPSFHPFTFAGKLLVAFVSTALSRASETAVLVQQKKRKRERRNRRRKRRRKWRRRRRGERKKKTISDHAVGSVVCPTILTRRENKSCDTHTREPRIGLYSPIVLPIHSLDFRNTASIPRYGLTFILIPNRKNFIWMNSHPHRDEFVACIDGRIKSRLSWLYLPLRSSGVDEKQRGRGECKEIFQYRI